jgi:hypothetical protein
LRVKFIKCAIIIIAIFLYPAVEIIASRVASHSCTLRILLSNKNQMHPSVHFKSYSNSCFVSWEIMSEHTSQQINTDSISDWSKWVIGLSLFSGSGCIGVLLTTGVKRANIVNIKVAILFFLLTILIAWIVQLFVAVVKSYSASKLETESEVIIISYKTARKWLKPFVIIEIITFTISLLFLIIWIMKLPAKDDVVAPTQQNAPSHSFNKRGENKTTEAKSVEINIIISAEAA